MDACRARHAARDTERLRDLAAEGRLGSLRLGLAGVALVLVLLPLFVRASWPWWALIPLGVAFAILGRAHDRAHARLAASTAATLYQRRELDRFEEKWRELPDTGADLAPTEVRAAARAGDLDLFGPASLFQLLSRGVTLYGRRTLAAWLEVPATSAEVRERQAAVRELAARPELGEALFVAATGDGRGALRDEALLEWAENLDPLPFRRVLAVLGVLEPIALVAGLLVYLFVDEGWPFAIAALAQIATLLLTRRLVEARASRISTPDRVLARYAAVIDVIEGAGFAAPRLVALARELRGGEEPASARIRELAALVERLDARLNVFFALTFGPALLWDLNHVLRAERWQRAVGGELRRWFASIGEIEALASLGAFAAARPDYAMPELVEEHGVLEAAALAHPLIDRNKVVANDLALGGPGSVLLLSGSNMSGKSTFLRAIAVNLTLARAGAPVAARSLRLSAVELVTSIRVSDSLARGTSHFYAELERIKEALDRAAASGGRILYLLDEMLHGTNSQERFIGAAGVIRHLSEVGAMGVVTTHDLALAAVAERLPPGRLVNMHFGDEVEEGRIRFDYVLTPGPVRSTNAIRLMRAIGIDIPLE